MSRPTRADQLLAACRVPPDLPAASHGRWAFEWLEVLPAFADWLGMEPDAPFACLSQWTMRTLHRERGYTVMEDTTRELRRHLPILLTARGRVLVTGLGLGCVLRGLLARPEVEHVDVVELDPWILRTFGAEFEGDPRVTLHLGDALTYPWPRGTRWDFAWHDVSTEDDTGLHVVHAQLLARYRNQVMRQGAWQLDLSVKARLSTVVPGMLNARAHHRRGSRLAAAVEPG